MCDRDHKEMTSNVLSSLVADGGGVKTVVCDECGEKFVVSYLGPVGLFASVERYSDSSVVGSSVGRS